MEKNVGFIVRERACGYRDALEARGLRMATRNARHGWSQWRSVSTYDTYDGAHQAIDEWATGKGDTDRGVVRAVWTDGRAIVEERNYAGACIGVLHGAEALSYWSNRISYLRRRKT